jgi:hypothetical protein
MITNLPFFVATIHAEIDFGGTIVQAVFSPGYSVAALVARARYGFSLKTHGLGNKGFQSEGE